MQVQHVICEVAGCTKPTRNIRSGPCEMHYERHRRTGSTAPGPRARLPLVDRFWRYVLRSEGCWLWTGPQDGHGYGRLTVGGRSGTSVGAHRISYELHVGPIPAGLDIDHLCRTPLCVNPAHMEPVTRGENTRRGTAIQRATEVRLARPTCKHGHAWTPSNTYTDPHGRRKCRTCERANDLRAKEKRRASVSQQ